MAKHISTLALILIAAATALPAQAQLLRGGNVGGALNGNIGGSLNGSMGNIQRPDGSRLAPLVSRGSNAVHDGVAQGRDKLGAVQERATQAKDGAGTLRDGLAKGVEQTPTLAAEGSGQGSVIAKNEAATDKPEATPAPAPAPAPAAAPATRRPALDTRADASGKASASRENGASAEGSASVSRAPR